MEIDHIYIFSQQNGAEAQHLVEAGFVEGSSRRHVGQGTQNRKFYTKDFFLEILWAVEVSELHSPVVRETTLLERSQFIQSGYSRFGMCLVNTPETDELFKDAMAYQPAYFPQGMYIDMLVSHEFPALPLIFRLPFQGKKVPANEPMNHSNGIERLSQAIFSVPELVLGVPLLKHFESHPQVSFQVGDRPSLKLLFDEGKGGNTWKDEALDLVIAY
ncbi:MAG: hypothetical protein AAGI38_09930 [Bacteroidota bacterium]